MGEYQDISDLVDKLQNTKFNAFNDIEHDASMKTYDALSCNCCANKYLFDKHNEKPFYIHFLRNTLSETDFLSREYMSEILDYKKVNKSNLLYEFDDEVILKEKIEFTNGKVYILHFKPISIYESKLKGRDNLILPFINKEIEKIIKDKYFFLIFKLHYVEVKLYSVEKLKHILKENGIEDDLTPAKKNDKKNKNKNKKNQKKKKRIKKKGKGVKIVEKDYDSEESEINNEDVKSEGSDDSDDSDEDTKNTKDVINDNDNHKNDDVKNDVSIVENHKLNIVFDKSIVFENKEYIITLINHVYNTKDKVKIYFDKYTIIIVIRDLHYDNYNKKNGLHFNIKCINECQTSPVIHAYINDGVISNLTFINSICD